jgi:cysteinyl-tRNA synthetase
MLQVEGKKMSKSLGNFFTVRDLLDQGIPGEVIRFVFLMTHYRSPMDWTAEKARQAEAMLRKIAQFLHSDPLSLPILHNASVTAPEEVVDALANDLNTSLALTCLNKYLKERDYVSLVGTLNILGFNSDGIKAKFAPFAAQSGANEFTTGQSVRTIGLSKATSERLVDLQNRLAFVRTAAMASKDFTAVDALKSALIAAGVEVRMSKAGVELVPGPDFDPAKLEALQ